MEKKETERTYCVLDVIPWVLNPGIESMKFLVHRYAEPAVSAGQDVIRKQVDVPLQKKFGMEVMPRIKTERDFTFPFLNTLDSINISQLDRQVPDWRQRTENGDTVRIGVRGNDYTPNYGGTRVSRSLTKRLTNPLFQIETTLGSYGIEATKDNITTRDTYDWDTNVHLDRNSSYGLVRELMNQYGTPDSVPENEKIKIRIKSKRTKKW